MEAAFKPFSLSEENIDRSIKSNRLRLQCSGSVQKNEGEEDGEQKKRRKKYKEDNFIKLNESQSCFRSSAFYH